MKELRPEAITDVSAQLQKHTEHLCRRLLPHGRRIEHEWHACWLHPIVTLHPDGSASCPIWDGTGTQVCVELFGEAAGTWIDHKSSARGNAFELVKVVCGLDALDAFEWCSAWLSGKPLPPHPAILRLARLIAKEMAKEAMNEGIISQHRRKK